MAYRRSVDEKWVRTKSDEAAIAEGCWFDPSAGQRVAAFFRRFLRHSIGRFADQPFELLPWQQDLIDRLYGWKRPDGTRRFREGYVEIPKKNGKSTMVSGLELYHLVADGERAAEVYTGAKDSKQARIIFKEVANMIAASPELSRRLDVVKSSKRVVYDATRSYLEALSADVGTKEGLNPSFCCIDELHVQPTRALYDTLRYGGVARDQALFFAITTAGEELESICYQVHEAARQVQDGTVIDTTFLGVIFAAEETDDLEDPRVWRKANPSLGFTIKEEDFRLALKAAQRSESDWQTFKRYRFNLWSGSTARYLDKTAWDACCQHPYELAAKLGQPCWAGLDLASNTDLAAFAALFPDGTLVVKFWKPSDSLLEHSRRDRVDYQAWARQGYLTATQGATIDYAQIRADVLAWHAKSPIAAIGIDPWNAGQLAHQLAEEDGLNVQFVRQGFASLSGPTKELDRMVRNHELRPGENPVLTWQADNAVGETDAMENVKLSKKMSRKRIDGLAASVNAVAMKILAPDDSGPSVYEERGRMFL